MFEILPQKIHDWKKKSLNSHFVCSLLEIRRKGIVFYWTRFCKSLRFFVKEIEGIYNIENIAKKTYMIAKKNH